MKNNIKKILEEKQILRRYLVLFLTMFVGAINYNLFLGPLKIVAGGTNGLSILVEEVFGMEPSMFILLFSIVVLVLSIFIVGFEKSSSALVATFVYPLFVDWTSSVNNIIQIDRADSLVIVILAGIISGWVAGATCRVDLSQGGVTLISQMIYEKFRISISKTNFFINMLIIIVGGICFGTSSILYAVTLLYVSSLVIDKVLLGISKEKTLYIVTDKYEQIRNYIVDSLGYGVTAFNAESGSNNKNKKVIMTAVPTSQYFKIKNRIKKIDKDVFLVITDSYQVVGGKLSN